MKEVQKDEYSRKKERKKYKTIVQGSTFWDREG